MPDTKVEQQWIHMIGAAGAVLAICAFALNQHAQFPHDGALSREEFSSYKEMIKEQTAEIKSMRHEISKLSSDINSIKYTLQIVLYRIDVTRKL